VGYCDFVGKVLTPLELKINPTLEEEPSIQQIKNACRELTSATKKFVEDYKKLHNIIPPQRFAIAHEKLIQSFIPYFETMFQLADQLEGATSPGTHAISVVFKHDSKEFLEFKQALDIAQTDQAKMKQSSTLEAIIVLAFILFFIIMVFYMLTTFLR